MSGQSIPSSSYDAILKQAGKQKSLIFNFSKTYPAYIILIIFVGLSFLVRDFFEKQVANESKNAYDKAVTSVINRFESKNLSNEQFLLSIRGVYDRLTQVVKDYFDLYATVPVKSYPSIRSIMYIQYVQDKELSDFIYYAQSTVNPAYQLHPKGKRQSYYPILYIVPEEKNFQLLGKDLAADQSVAEILNKSRENDNVVATHVFDVRQPDTLGMYVIIPVYKKDSNRSTAESRKKNYEGSVVIELDPTLFFQEALGDGIASDTTLVFECIESSGKQHHVFQSKNFTKFNGQYSPDIASDEIITIADREFKVHFATIPEFTGSFQKLLPTLAFLISIVLSFAFFGFLLAVTTSKARAVDLAERLTRSQRRIVESSKDIIAVMDFDGFWKSMNTASIAIFGTPPAELIGSNINKLFTNEKDLSILFSNIENTTDEYTLRTDFLMNAAAGDTKWLNWSFTISKPDGLIYCIGRDVTLEKLAEEQARLRSKQIQLAEQFTREASEFKSYFMIKLSHQLRNSLTGIIGYLQLLNNQIYESEEEHDSYLNLAEESSEELFAFISDIDDVSSSTGETVGKDLATLKFAKSSAAAADKVIANAKDTKITVNLMEESADVKVVANADLLEAALYEVFEGLRQGSDNVEITISATENPYEGATELQIMTNANPLVTDLIEVYKKNSNNLIEALKFDVNDIILHLSIATSNIRMMNGTMTVETFGADEGNIVQITLPLSKRIES